jgi:hypothetical protein
LPLRVLRCALREEALRHALHAGVLCHLRRRQRAGARLRASPHAPHPLLLLLLLDPLSLKLTELGQLDLPLSVLQLALVLLLLLHRPLLHLLQLLELVLALRLLRVRPRVLLRVLLLALPLQLGLQLGLHLLLHLRLHLLLHLRRHLRRHVAAEGIALVPHDPGVDGRLCVAERTELACRQLRPELDVRRVTVERRRVVQV